MKKIKWLLGIIVLVSLIVSTGCGAKRNYTTEETKAEMATADMAYHETSNYAGESSLEESVEMDFNDEAQSIVTGASSESINRNQALSNRKIIKTGNVYMETTEFDQTITDIKNLISTYSAYTSSSTFEGGMIDQKRSRRTAYYTIKVPAESFENMYESIQGIGNVLNASDSIEDVTNSITDIEARIKTLEVQEARLLDTLEKVETLEAIVELEHSLQEVRYEIERYSASLRNLEDQVRYSTIHLNVQEVYEETIIEKKPLTMGERIQLGLAQTFKEIRQGAENIIVFVIVEFPYILFTVFVIVICYVILRKVLKKGQSNIKKAEVKVENTSESDEDNIN